MKQQYSKERGFILACVCIVLALLFALAAAALDAGNLYLWRLRLEKATRAGAVAGLGYRALKGWQTIYGGTPKFDGTTPRTRTYDDSAEMRALANQARSIIVENMRAMYPSPSYLEFVTTRLMFYDDDGVGNRWLPPNAYRPVDDSILIRASYSVPTILAGRLQGMGVNLGCSQQANAQPGECLVGTEQRAQLAPATVAMVLDTSGSMICEDGQPDCSCRGDPVNPCGSGARIANQVITHLKNAALDFHAFFNPFRDRIALVPFNLAARVSRPIVRRACTGINDVPLPFGGTPQAYRNFVASIIDGYPSTEPANVAAIKSAIISRTLNDQMTDPNDCPGSSSRVSGLVPVSNTNPCDGFIRAANELQRARNLLNAGVNTAGENRTPLTVVFFTDGAPNAFRASFIDPALITVGGTELARTAATLKQQTPLRCGSGANAASSDACNDWYQYAVEWRDSPLNPPYRGPGPLVHGTAGNELFNFEITVNETTDALGNRIVTPVTYPMNPPYADTAVTCGDNRSDRTLFDKVLKGEYTSNTVHDGCTQTGNSPLKLGDGTRCGCLRTVDFSLPTLLPLRPAAVSNVNFSRRYTLFGGGGAFVDLSSSDQLPYYCAIEAADWIRVNLQAQVFTIGLGERSPWCGDPMQDADNHFKRKDYFLSRLAFSSGSVNQADQTQWDSRHQFSPRRNVTMQQTDPACAQHRFFRDRLNGGGNTMEIGYGTALKPPTVFAPGTRGAYYGADSARQLSEIFTQTAKQILLRLGS